MIDVTFENTVLTAGITWGGKKPATTIAIAAAISAYSIKSCPSRSILARVHHGFLSSQEAPPTSSRRFLHLGRTSIMRDFARLRQPDFDRSR
jgi:hypothetical protein